jgi:hypothetical protein
VPDHNVKFGKGAGIMSDTNREIQELLIDYAGALRDGSIPVFLKSLTRAEGQAIALSEEFWDATEVVRVLNDVGFADKAAVADVGLFASRVDANIASRSKKSRKSVSRRHGTRSKLSSRIGKTEKQI